MKQRITTAGVICLLIFLLKFPEESLFAARDGMKLWLNTLFPTLLPFLILTGILLHTKGIEKFLSPLSFFWEKLLGLTPCGAYVFLLGILCGYPMGAKLTSDLYQKNKISKKEASYLLTFSNNPSPGFLTAYVSQICLGGRTKAHEITGILLLANLMCMLFFRFIIYKNKTFTPISPSKKETSAVSSPGAVIDVSIMNGFETITRLGGYILLFSILGGSNRTLLPCTNRRKIHIPGHHRAYNRTSSACTLQSLLRKEISLCHDYDFLRRLMYPRPDKERVKGTAFCSSLLCRKMYSCSFHCSSRLSYLQGHLTVLHRQSCLLHDRNWT